VSPAATPLSLYELSSRTLEGDLCQLDRFRGQVLLIVNVASECGFTPQYAELETLQQRFGAKGFSVLGFPCDQFGHQEPGGPEEIRGFCEQRFGVTFPLFEKIEVNGPNCAPLYVFLKQRAAGLLGTTAIKWNFTKFLVNRAGAVVRRYAPTTKPSAIAGDIQALL
jgi:glutathione peroxidase